MTEREPTCVVLGGGGFLGVNLCRRLVSSGVRVRAFGRRCLFPQDLAGVEWRQGDFCDTAALASAVASCETVFHLVHTYMPQSADLNMAEDVRQNVVSSLGLLEISRKLKVKRIIFVSSGGIVYGPTPHMPTPETAPTDPISAYGISKLTIEKYLRLYEHHYGLTFRVLRVANPFGPFQLPEKNQGVIAALISYALHHKEFEIWGDGSTIRDYIYVSDVVDALLLAAADESEERIFNIGSGQGRDLRQVIAEIEASLGIELVVRRTKGRLIDVPVSVLAIEKARDILGWRPQTPFDVGIKQTIAWWRSRDLSLWPP
jgi:UDP-glucose 4-epimerase